MRASHHTQLCALAIAWAAFSAACGTPTDTKPGSGTSDGGTPTDQRAAFYLQAVPGNYRSVEDPMLFLSNETAVSFYIDPAGARYGCTYEISGFFGKSTNGFGQEEDFCPRCKWCFSPETGKFRLGFLLGGKGFFDPWGQVYACNCNAFPKDFQQCLKIDNPQDADCVNGIRIKIGYYTESDRSAQAERRYDKE